MIEINWPQLFTVILFITVAVVGIEGFVGRIRERRIGSSIRRNLLQVVPDSLAVFRCLG